MRSRSLGLRPRVCTVPGCLQRPLLLPAPGVGRGRGATDPLSSRFPVSSRFLRFAPPLSLSVSILYGALGPGTHFPVPFPVAAFSPWPSLSQRRVSAPSLGAPSSDQRQTKHNGTKRLSRSRSTEHSVGSVSETCRMYVKIRNSCRMLFLPCFTFIISFNPPHNHAISAIVITAIS